MSIGVADHEPEIGKIFPKRAQFLGVAHQQAAVLVAGHGLGQVLYGRLVVDDQARLGNHQDCNQENDQGDERRRLQQDEAAHQHPLKRARARFFHAVARSR